MMTSPPLEDSVLVTAHRFVSDENTDELSNNESLIENRHVGWLVISHLQNGLLYSTPGAEQTATFFRSSAKPFQAFPLVQGNLHTMLSKAELAITCASHVGSQQHIDLASSILKKAGLSELQLQCGPHIPLDKAMRAALKAENKSPNALHNNCSGKHSGMLFYCQQQNLRLENYLAFQHPLQQKIIEQLRHWGDINHIPTAIDGCGAPVFYLPLKTMAHLYAHLGSTEAFAPLQQAMSNHPELIGGEGRVDTVIMQASQGKLLAKVGADGVLCVSQIGSGEGLALKIADGNESVRNLATVEMLTRLGWLDKQATQDSRLAIFQNQKRLNTQNKVVGHYQIHYPPL